MGGMHRRSFIATANVAIVAHAAESAGLATVLREDSFVGSNGGDVREVGGVRFCWCPPGKFTMGSPPNEPERRPGEDQVDVTLTKGFWMAKYEATQGDWRRVIGKLPGPLTAELPEGYNGAESGPSLEWLLCNP